MTVVVSLLGMLLIGLEFIEVFYNRQRPQTGLGHLTPAEYADKWRRNRGEPNHT